MAASTDLAQHYGKNPIHPISCLYRLWCKIIGQSRFSVQECKHGPMPPLAIYNLSCKFIHAKCWSFTCVTQGQVSFSTCTSVQDLYRVQLEPAEMLQPTNQLTRSSLWPPNLAQIYRFQQLQYNLHQLASKLLLQAQSLFIG